MFNHNALLVSEKEAAKLLAVSVAMLVARRFQKRPLLPFVRIGSRTIRYRVADINAFIDRNTNRTAVNDVANGATLRQAADRHGLSKSAVHRAVPREENSQEGQPAETPLQTAEGEPAVADANSLPEMPAFLRRSPT
jgi:predicted DNA-binding transcriptional regulator AlpA